MIADHGGGGLHWGAGLFCVYIVVGMFVLLTLPDEWRPWFERRASLRYVLGMLAGFVLIAFWPLALFVARVGRRRRER